MKALFKVGTKSFSDKADAKAERDATGKPITLGIDHMGKHGYNKVSQHMRNKRLGKR